MRDDQVAIGDDTYETTTLPAYTSVSSHRHGQSEDMHPPASCENMGVSKSVSNRISAQRIGLLGSTQNERIPGFARWAWLEN